jgi:preprotein translocase subunit SecG
MEWLVQLADWLEMVVVWMAAIFAVLALVLSIYNTFALHTLRRELEDPREEARQSPTENAEPMEENYPARST